MSPEIAKYLLTRLQEEKRANALRRFLPYLSAKEAAANSGQQLAYRTLRYSLEAGAPLGASIKAAMPNVSSEDISRIANRLCKEASEFRATTVAPTLEPTDMISLLATKAAMLNASATGQNMPSVKSVGETTFTGSIADGSSFLGSM